MITKKGGTVLVNLDTKKIALVYRKDTKDLAFPKGHLEEGETLQECAIRETEEETGRKNHLADEKEIDIIKYITSRGEDVELYMYIAIVIPNVIKNEIIVTAICCEAALKILSK